MTLADATSSLFSVRAVDDMCRDKVDDDVIRNVERIIELVMIRNNTLQLSSNVFSLMDIRDVISFSMYKLIAYLYVFCVVFFILYYFLCVLRVRFYIK